MKKVLVTGAAGFIGFHLSKRLCNENYYVVGIDNINDYYDVTLKNERLSILKDYNNFSFIKMDLTDKERIFDLFQHNSFDYVINLAAQAGVRYSIENPYAYIDSNIVGFLNVLEAIKKYPVKHLLYASSSSVYGGNLKIPFSVEDSVDHPVSLYAATKKSNELFAHTYSNLYSIPTTGLRFFTVYGPYGRPDMAYFSFSEKIMRNEKIQIYNNGQMERDFTYIDDVIESVYRLLENPPTADTSWNEEMGKSRSYAPYRILNVGNNKPKSLMEFIKLIEMGLGKKADKEYLPMQDGDVKKTYADITELSELIDYQPSTSLEKGLSCFTEWFLERWKRYE